MGDDLKYLRAKVKLMACLSRHIGKNNAIGMGELYEEVFGKSWNHRINDTRALRRLISDLKAEGVSILSSPNRFGGGYYLAAAASELEEFYRKRREAALRILSLESRMRNMAMPELLGQIAMHLQGSGVGEGKNG